MKKIIILFVLMSLVKVGFAQEKIINYKVGEKLEYRLSYSGFFKAGSVSLELRNDTIKGKEVVHAIGKGRTTGVVKWGFDVNDVYETFFEPNAVVKPLLFKRNINEDGYKKHRKITFDYKKNKANISDFITKKDTVVSVKNVQDLLSCFYYLRSYDTSKLKKGEYVNVNMFFDNQTYPFKLKFLGRDVLKTKYGKVKSLKFRPLVQSGRIFKAKESVTVWISEDDNKIPLKVKANLKVGSLRADLSSYKNLLHPFKTIE